MSCGLKFINATGNKIPCFLYNLLYINLCSFASCLAFTYVDKKVFLRRLPYHYQVLTFYSSKQLSLINHRKTESKYRQRFSTYKNPNCHSVQKSISEYTDALKLPFGERKSTHNHKLLPCCTGLILRRVFFVLKSGFLSPSPHGMRHVSGKIEHNSNKLSLP